MHQMDGVNSYEQRSLSEGGPDLDVKQHRVIIADRHNQSVAWSTSNQANSDTTYGHRSGCGSSRLSRLVRRLFRRPRRPDLQHQQQPSGSLLWRPPVARVVSSQSSSLSGTNLAYHHFGPFCSNEWLTSKYTLLNFVPKNLFEQFRRLANFYFLITAIIQILLPFSPVGPFTSLTPLIFVVGVTAIKQAYEDFMRHRSDAQLNNRQYNILQGNKLARTKSKDIKVGDLVFVRNNEEIPCDIILLSSSISGDRCYITTSNLDGETSLKSRTCSSIQDQIGGLDRLNDTLLVLECEQPSATLYEFSGSLRAPKTRRSYESLVKTESQDDDQQHQQQQRSQNRGRNSSQRISNRDLTDSEMMQKIMQRMKQSHSNPRPQSPSTTTTPSTSSASTPQQMPQLTNKSVGSTESQLSGPNLQQQQKQQQQQQQLPPSKSIEVHEIPLDINNFLPRASRLCNTAYIYGLCVYTGHDTKLARNSQVKPNKFSSMESKLNTFLIISFLMLTVMTITAAAREIYYHWKRGAEFNIGQIILAHFLLYNYLMPISLYVTLEFVKFFGTNAVIEDNKMKTYNWRSVAQSKDGELHGSTPMPGSSSSGPVTTAEPKRANTKSKSENSHGRRRAEILEAPKCNSSDLNEELGQIEVLFSDKTGTLTENRMLFMACTLNSHLYRCIEQQLYLDKNIQLTIVGVAREMAKLHRGRHSKLTFQSSSQRPAHHVRRAYTPNHFDHRFLPPKAQLQPVDRLESHEKLVQFFICLCLCSTITLNESMTLDECIAIASKKSSRRSKNDHNGEDFDYRSASPDEESLISAAKQFGITLCKSNDRESYILIKRSGPTTASAKLSSSSNDGKFKAIVETKQSNEHFLVRHFERLMLLEFNSARKRMSVIYRDCDNDCILMVCKGSEELLDCLNLAHLNSATETQIDTTLAHFEAFSRSGLRALLVAMRNLSSDEYKSIEKESKEIKMAIGRRDYLLESLYHRTERHLTLIGATAVEDTLQEGVPDMIVNLKEAGIKVWLLTGDKVETAISVAYLCKLLEHDMRQFHMVRQRDMQSCKKLITAFLDQVDDMKRKTRSQTRTKSKPISAFKSLRNEPKFALIADGRSLHYAMKYAKLDLARLCKQCTCVLGCRLSPLQKAEVVSMIKQDPEHPITAAIGDGANDVSMIQEAHVGIGIMGKEGRQAVNSSDFAIGRFQKLNRLLFVHGHLFYHRAAHITHYFFYKNTLFVMPQFIYSFYSLSSRQSLYHPMFMISFNLFFTSLPILVYGLYETHIPEDILEKYPRLYRMYRNNSLLTIGIYLTWIGVAFLQTLIGFFFLESIWGNNKPLIEPDSTASSSDLSIELFVTVVLLATLRLYLMAKSHGPLLHLSCLMSILAVPGFVYFVGLLESNSIIGPDKFYEKFLFYTGTTMFWLATLSTTVVCLLPDLIWFLRDQIVNYKSLKMIIKYHDKSEESVQQ